MGFNLASYAIPGGYNTNVDLVDSFGQGLQFGQGQKNAQDAKTALGEYVRSLYAGGSPGQPQPAQATSQLAGSTNPIDRLIGTEHASAEAATDPTLATYFSGLAQRESGGDPNATNPSSSATGLYQITDQTWTDLAKQHPELGLTADGRTDPAQQQKAVRALTQDNARSLSGAGIAVNPGSLYAAHFLGAPTATQVLGFADNTPMSAAVSPDVLQANPQLAQMSVGDFKQWAAGNGAGQGGGYQPPMAQPTSGPGLPPENVLEALMANPDTRQFGAGVIKQAQDASNPGGSGNEPADLQSYRFYREQEIAAGRQPLSYLEFKQTTAGGGSAGTTDDANSIAQAIVDGKQPPDLKGLYKLGGPVRAALASQGYDLTKANQDWTATNKLLATMNGAQQTRLRQAVGQVDESLDLVDKLAQQWKAGGLPLVNTAIREIAKNGLTGNPQAQSLATQLQAEISDITSELGTVYKGGNSSTDESLRLAATQLNADWSEDTLRNAIALAKQNIAYRKNSLNLSTAGVQDSQYNSMTQAPLPVPQITGSGVTAPPLNAPAGEKPPSSYDGDPSLWQYMTPEERKLWQ